MKRFDWVEHFKTCGGQAVKGDRICDGVRYQFRSIWNSDKDVDHFLATLPAEYFVVCDRKEEDTFIHLFFSVFPAKPVIVENIGIDIN